MSKNDPTDHALAAIASIVDRPPQTAEQLAPPPAVEFENSPPPELPREMPSQIHGYSKKGPGRISELQFKWIVRDGGGGVFFVDETIGDSQPITTGPMRGDEAVRLVDDRERGAQIRFDLLKGLMTGANDERAARENG